VGRARRFNTRAPETDKERRADATPEEDIVTPAEVAAEVNRIADIVKSWPPELQVVRVRDDTRSG
jgi:hypothetical protein